MTTVTHRIRCGTEPILHEQEDDTVQIHRQRAPPDPAVMDQTCHHKREHTDSHPIRLLSPEIRCVCIAATRSRAVDCYDTKNGEREHRHQQKPVLTEELSQKRRHTV